MKVIYIFCLCICVHSVLGIVGGGQVDIKNHPYQVSVLSNGKFISSGIILQNDLILTDITANRQLFLKYMFPQHDGVLSVRAGSSQVDTGGIVINVTSSNVIKSNFEDFSVLYLDKPLAYNDNISNIRLGKILPSIGSICSISGWGVNSKHFEYPPNLQGVNVTLVQSKDCQTISNSSEPAMDGQLCIMGGDACIGDSGAPLVCNDVLIGIASSLPHCNTEFGGSYIDIQSILPELEILDFVSKF